MAVNQVKFGNQIVIDITDSTVNANTLLAGYKAYGANGEQVTGNVELSYHITLRQDQYDELSQEQKLDEKNYFYIDDVSNSGVFTKLTQAQYDALTPEQKANGSYLITDATVLGVDLNDNVVSANQVWSSQKVNGLINNIAETMEQNGAHNLLPFPYYSGGTQVISSFTLTVNDSGVDKGKMSASGTANESNRFNLYVGTLPKNNYKFRFVGSLSGVKVAIYDYVTEQVIDDAGANEDITLTVDATNENHNFLLYLRWDAGSVSISGRPLFKLASDPSDDDAPYAMTNQELTNNVIYKHFSASDYSGSNSVEKFENFVDNLPSPVGVNRSYVAQMYGASDYTGVVQRINNNPNYASAILFTYGNEFKYLSKAGGTWSTHEFVDKNNYRYKDTGTWGFGGDNVAQALHNLMVYAVNDIGFNHVGEAFTGCASWVGHNVYNFIVRKIDNTPTYDLMAWDDRNVYTARYVPNVMYQAYVHEGTAIYE